MIVMETDFQKDIRIDPDRLDEEALRQAELFFEYSERAAEARSKIDRAKFDLELTYTNLVNSIRKDPAKYGLVKITDSSIESFAKGKPVYRDAYEKWIIAKRDSSILDVAVVALEQKKRMIETLVTLHGQQYFAGPSMPHDLVSRWKDSMKARAERVNALVAETVRTPKGD